MPNSNLYVVSVNTLGYLPDDTEPFIGHADADTLTSVLAELIVSDGEHSIESVMSSGSDTYDSEDEMLSDSASDSGMVELWQSGHEAYRDALEAITRALAEPDRFDGYSYSIEWSSNSLPRCYFVQRSPDATHCTDETCDICYVDTEEK